MMKKINFYKSVHILKYCHAQDEMENKTCSNVLIRGGLTPWALHFRGPSHYSWQFKKGPNCGKITFARGPKRSQSTPGSDRITYNEKSLKLVDLYGLDSVLIDGWTVYSMYIVNP